MLEEPIEDRVVPPKSIREEEPKTREDQDEPESEEEQWSLVLFTQEQLESSSKWIGPISMSWLRPSKEDHPRM